MWPWNLQLNILSHFKLFIFNSVNLANTGLHLLCMNFTILTSDQSHLYFLTYYSYHIIKNSVFISKIGSSRVRWTKNSASWRIMLFRVNLSSVQTNIKRFIGTSQEKLEKWGSVEYPTLQQFYFCKQSLRNCWMQKHLRTSPALP